MTLTNKILGAIALGMSLVTAAPALAQTIYVGPGYGAPPPFFHYHHRWHHGEFYRGPLDVVHHPDAFGLSWPPYGFAWIRAPHQFLLINLSNGWISHDVFR